MRVISPGGCLLIGSVGVSSGPRGEGKVIDGCGALVYIIQMSGRSASLVLYS